MPNVKTTTLSGTETKVTLPQNYPYCFITNMSEAEIYASGNPGVVPYADGVYTIPAGTEIRISPEASGDTLWLLGSGKVQIRGEEIAAPTSFKRSVKGGEISFSGDYNDLTNKPDIPVPSEVIDSNSTNKTVSTSKSVFDYVNNQVSGLVGAAPDTLDTLEELAAAIQDNNDVINILNAAITNKADKSALSNYAALSDLSAKQDIITKPPIIDNSVDWNTLTETAIYPVGIQNGESLSDSSTHGLSSAYPYGFLIVMARLNYNGWLYQLYINDRSEVYIRSLYTSWRSWVRIDAGAIDLSELRAKIEAIETTGWNFKSPIFDGPKVTTRVLCKIPVSTNTTNPGNLQQNISFILCGGINFGNVFKGTYLIEVSNRNKKFSSSITKLSGSADAKFYYYEENDYWVLCVGNVGYLSSLTMTVLNADNKKPDDILKNLEYGSLEVTAYPVENMTALPLQKVLTSADITPEMIDKINNL